MESLMGLGRRKETLSWEMAELWFRRTETLEMRRGSILMELAKKSLRRFSAERSRLEVWLREDLLGEDLLFVWLWLGLR